MKPQNISDEYLNSFIDGQLDSGEKIHALNAISQNEQLRERVCEIYTLKEMLKQAYPHPTETAHTSHKHRWHRTLPLQSLAAALLLFVGGTAGWLTHTWATNEGNHENHPLVQATQRLDPLMEERKVIVHIGSANPMRLVAVLDETEGLLESYKRVNRAIHVEVIANKQGVNLLRSDVTAYKERISNLQEKYPNLNFLVCGQTLAKLHNSGVTVQLLPHTGVAISAADQINKRLQQGWGYIRI